MGEVSRRENQFKGKLEDIHGIMEFPNRASATEW